MIDEILSQLKEFEPEYEVVLPHSQKKVLYRPFKIKDQKTLALIIQQNNTGIIVKKICEIVSNCSTEKNPEQLHICDLEFLFLNIRAKSVEEKIYLLVGEQKRKMAIEIDKIEFNPGLVKKTLITNNNVSLELEIPKAKDYFNLANLDDDQLINAAIKSLVIKNKKYDLSLIKPKEIQQIVDEISLKNYEELKQFIAQGPKLFYTLNGPEGNIVLEGFLRFFI